jgi:hypothetical protein
MRSLELACLLSGLALSACGVAPPRSVFPTADDAIARMRATNACENGVQGEGKIDHFSPKGRVRGNIAVLAVYPARVRFDVFHPLGATLYALTSDGERFQMYDLSQKQFLEGPASPCNLARLTQVPVPGHALVAILQGQAPVLKHDKSGASIAWDEHGFYRLLFQSAHEATEEVHLTPHPDDFGKPWSEQRIRVLDVRVAQRGIDLYRAQLENHKPMETFGPRVDPDGIDPPVPPSGPACNAELPRSIRMRVPNTEEDVIFQYKEVKWNPPIIAGAFEQPVPGGVRKMHVDCGR